MFNKKNFMFICRTLAAFTMISGAFAQDYDMPSIPVPMGPASSQVQSEREEVIRLRNRKGDSTEGKGESLLCQGCHGEDGNSADSQIPKLAGQYGNYIIKQVRNFQLGSRSNEIMSSMAATITDNDLYDAAAYYSSQESMQGSETEANPLGKKLFSDNSISELGLACFNCHGESGHGLERRISAFPVIGGQHKDYIRKQLIDFREGNRSNSPNNIMNRVTATLTDEQIDALAEFLASQ